MVRHKGPAKGKLPTTIAEPVVNEIEAAAVLGIGRSRLQQLRVSGEGPPFVELAPVGPGRVRLVYPVAGLHAWLANRRGPA